MAKAVCFEARAPLRLTCLSVSAGRQMSTLWTRMGTGCVWVRFLEGEDEARR